MPPRDRTIRRLPPWFRVRIASGGAFDRVDQAIRDRDLHTVCTSAACPNRGECWSAGTATFLILGDSCTRSCAFCNMASGSPSFHADDEAARVADAVVRMGLTYAVITSVTRDDLPDGGASAFAGTIRAIRERVPECPVEVLVPDFRGSRDALNTVLNACPVVVNHNMETVPSLYAAVRPQADYERSLDLLRQAKQAGATTKSGFMVGLGETAAEISALMDDLRSAGCDILTIGQYLRPRQRNIPVVKYYHPDEFARLKRDGDRKGFRAVAAGPRIRSSYHARGLQSGNGSGDP